MPVAGSSGQALEEPRSPERPSGEMTPYRGWDGWRPWQASGKPLLARSSSSSSSWCSYYQHPWNSPTEAAPGIKAEQTPKSSAGGRPNAQIDCSQTWRLHRQKKKKPDLPTRKPACVRETHPEPRSGCQAAAKQRASPGAEAKPTQFWQPRCRAPCSGIGAAGPMSGRAGEEGRSCGGGGGAGDFATAAQSQSQSRRPQGEPCREPRSMGRRLLRARPASAGGGEARRNVGGAGVLPRNVGGAGVPSWNVRVAKVPSRSVRGRRGSSSERSALQGSSLERWRRRDSFSERGGGDFPGQVRLWGTGGGGSGEEAGVAPAAAFCRWGRSGAAKRGAGGGGFCSGVALVFFSRPPSGCASFSCCGCSGTFKERLSEMAQRGLSCLSRGGGLEGLAGPFQLCSGGFPRAREGSRGGARPKRERGS